MLVHPRLSKIGLEFASRHNIETLPVSVNKLVQTVPRHVDKQPPLNSGGKEVGSAYP